MNRDCYRLVFSDQTNTWVPVAEIFTARGKRSRAARKGVLAAVVLSLSGLAQAGNLSAGTLPNCPAGVCGANYQPTVTLGGTNALTYAVSGTSGVINQNVAKVSATWNSFDIARNASVIMNQPKGGAALFRVLGGQFGFTQIEGSLKVGYTEAGTFVPGGSLFLLNQNGVLFANGASVDAGTLVASSLRLSDDKFNAGILTDKNAAAFGDTDPATGFVKVENGATLTAYKGGKLMLLAPQVENAGTLTAPDGQVVLAAGSRVYLASSEDTTMRGLWVEVDNPDVDTVAKDANGTPTGAGVAINTSTGKITTDRGNTTMIGLAVNQMGRISAKTAVSANGSILLLARDTTAPVDTTSPRTGTATRAGTVTLGQGSVTEALPDESDTSTSLDAQTFSPSRVDLMGSNIILKSGASITAPGGNVSLTALTVPKNGIIDGASPTDSRILMEAGSSIDVHGSTLSLPMSRNIIAVELRGDELKDSPLLRYGVLRGKTVYVDIRKGTSIADISGYLAQTGRTVTERTAAGGTVTMKSEGDVVLKSGSTVNISGGAINYLAGAVTTSKLLSGGKVYDIGSASADMVYDGLVSGSSYTVTDKWGTHTYTLPFSIATAEGAYTDYKSAGTLTVVSPYAYLGGDIVGAGGNGINQRTSGSNGGTLIIGNAGATASNGVYDYHLLADVVLTQSSAALADSWAGDDALPQAFRNTLTLSTAMLARSGLAKVKVYSDGKITVAEDAALALPAGGTLSLTGSNVDVRSDVKVTAGTINLAATRTLTSAADVTKVEVGPDVTLDARGMWVNDYADTRAGKALGQALTGGGSISISSYDDVVLASGSVLDVSGGGQVTTAGKVSYGKGGSVTLAAQSGKKEGDTPGGGLVLNGVVKGYSATGGGTFTLEAANVGLEEEGANPFANTSALNNAVSALAASAAYGGDKRAAYDAVIAAVRSGTAESSVVAVLQGLGYGSAALSEVRANLATLGQQLVGNMVLSTAALTQGGFSSYALTGLDGLTVSTGTSVKPQTENLIVNPAAAATLATGSNLSDIATLGYLPLWQRTAASLSLTAGKSGRGALGNLLVDQGAVIATDPGASVTLTARNRISIDGSITAAGGAVTAILEGDAGTTAYDDVAQSIWLGNDASISVAGTFVKNEDGSRFTRGKSFGGGSITLNAKVGSVITESGSLLDVSGASAYVDSTVSPGSGGTVATAGGSIAVSARKGLFLNGEYAAAGGSSAVQGGSLKVTLDSANLTNVVFTNDTNARVLSVLDQGSLLPATYVSGDALDASLAGTGSVRADRINSGGFSSVSLSAEDQIRFPGSVSLHTPLYLTLNTPDINLADGANVTLSSYSTSLMNTLNIGATVPAASSLSSATGTGVLNVTGDVIDLQGPFKVSGVSNTRIASSGDLRLEGILPTNTSVFSPYGALVTAGDLVLEAGRIYPTTLTRFDIVSSGKVTVNGNDGNSAAPYSVGGSISIKAANIKQAGVIRAPFGTITLTADDTLDLVAGSITSVSAEGTVIPFGQTQNGTEWAYDFGDRIALFSAPPKGTISLSGKDVVLQGATSDKPAATVNASGGGNLSAYEFTAGTGGSKDVLAQAGTYALVPDWSSDVAPVDYEANLTSSPLTGQRIYISGGSGLAAGVYVLMPASYALKSGAYAIKLISANNDVISAGSSSKLSGASTVSGYLVNGDGTRTDTRWSSFTLTPGSVVRTQSEYSETTATAFYTALAASSGSATPALPNDAGLISLSATHGMTLDGQLLLAASGNGEKGSLDIAAPKILVTSGDMSDEAGVIKLSAQKLNSFDVGSLMLGGTRVVTTSGTTATVVADQVTVSNDKNSVLSVPELILAAKDAVTISDGAVIEASGNAVSAPTTFVLKNNSGSGDVAAAVRLSAGGETVFSRSGAVPANYLDAGGKSRGVFVGSATLAATGSIQLDSLYMNSLHIDPADKTKDTKLLAHTIGLAASRIGMGDGATGATNALVITPGLLSLMSGLEALTLRSYTSIDLYRSASGNVTGLPDSLALARLTLDAPLVQAVESNVAAAFSATNISLENTTGVTAPTAAGGSGSLTLTATGSSAGSGRISLGQGSKSVAGFDTVTFAADRDIVFEGSGTTNVAQGSSGLLTLRSALISAAAGSQQTLTGSGTVKIESVTATDVAAAGAGGILSIAGARVEQGGNIDLSGGTLSLSATGSLADDDVVLKSGSATRAKGIGKWINDYFARADAGSITLSSSSGSVRIDEGAEVSVAAGAGTNAGSLTLSAAKGHVVVAGNLSGGAGSGGHGGSVTVDAYTLGEGTVANPYANDLASFNSAVRQGGFDQAIDIRARRGDLTVANGSANTIKAKSVTLTADDGSITVAGTIDASGSTGGAIALYAKSGASGAGRVTLANGGELLAQGTGSQTTGSSGDGGQVILSGEGTATDQVRLDGGSINVSATDSKASAGSILLRAPRTVIASDLNAISAGGSATAMTVADSTVSSYAVGTVVTFKATNTNTGAVTLNVNGKGAKTLVNNGGSTLTAGAITQGQIVTAVYDGSKFQITSSSSGASGTPSVGTGVAISPIASTLVGTNTVNVEANKVYSYDNSLGVKVSTSTSSNTAGAESVLSQAVLKADNLAFMSRESAITGALVGTRSDLNILLRPGVEIRNTGDVTIGSDLNLASVSSSGVSEWRYGSNLLGGALTLRAGGSVKINSTINDGVSGIASGSTLLSGDSWSYRFSGGADLSSANPMAVIASSTSGDVAVAAGKFVRTGRGSIQVAAGRDVTLGSTSNVNTVATSTLTAASIYTVGQNQWDGFTLFNSGVNMAGIGGGVTINAKRNIASVASNQLIYNWLYRQGSSDGLSAAWGASYDALLSTPVIGALGGGDVVLNAGGNIVNVSVNAANSGFVDSSGTLNTLGQGNLTVRAGYDIKGGVYFVANGLLDLQAGHDVTYARTTTSGNLYPILALMEGSAHVSAANALTIETALNPTLMPMSSTNLSNSDGLYSTNYQPFYSTYGINDEVSLTALGGDLTIEYGKAVKNILKGGGASNLFPGSLSAVALNGSVVQTGAVYLAGSPRGSLDLIGAANVTISGVYMLDTMNLPTVSANLMGSDTTLSSLITANKNSSVMHGGYMDPVSGEVYSLLHEGDSDPVRIYAGTGDVVGGSLYSPKSVVVKAGRDVQDLNLSAQNLTADAETSLSAGRDIVFSVARQTNNELNSNSDLIEVAGGGVVSLTAGRNVDLGNSNGVVTVGNLYNPALPDRGASIVVTAGAAGGGDYTALLDAYVNPATAATPSLYGATLLAYVRSQLGDDSITQSQAWTSFQNLTSSQQQAFARKVFFAELKAAGDAYNATVNPDTTYARGYAAINTLYPTTKSYAGSINLFFSELKTEQGGDIHLFAPGGKVVVGLTNVPSALAAQKKTAGLKDSAGNPLDDSASRLGIMTLRGGDIMAMSNGDFLVNQSRVFTLNGTDAIDKTNTSDILLWSTVGNIDAGKGKKTAVSAPPPIIRTDAQGNIVIDSSGAVSGSGIGSLLTVTGNGASDVSLIAPKGEVSAGDAGIRVSGNLNIAAQRVTGLDNIQVGGVSAGVPAASSGTTVASAAGLGSSEASRGADGAAAALGPSAGIKDPTSLFNVEIAGLGDDDSRKSSRE